MMEIIKEGIDAAKNLIPPSSGASDSHIRRWRHWMAMATFLNALGLSAHVLLACGFIAPFYPGFAQASDISGVRAEMKEVKDTLRTKRVNELGSLMLDAKQKQCTATGEAKRLYLVSYNALRAEYFDLADREFPDPPCSDFI